MGSVAPMIPSAMIGHPNGSSGEDANRSVFLVQLKSSAGLRGWMCKSTPRLCAEGSDLRVSQRLLNDLCGIETPSPDRLTPESLSRMAVGGRVAFEAECDQILFRIDPRMAAKLFVMNFQVCHRAARLTSPVITTQDLLLQMFIRHWIQPQAWRLLANRTHETFSLSPPRNA